jgi:hypothetical protein
MQGNVIGFVTLDFVLRLIFARVVGVAFEVNISRVHLDDGAADAPSLRIPGHSIANLEPFHHDGLPSVSAAARELDDRPPILQRMSGQD